MRHKIILNLSYGRFSMDFNNLDYEKMTKILSNLVKKYAENQCLDAIFYVFVWERESVKYF